MATKSGHNNQTDELRDQIAQSREQVGRNLRGLRYEMDLPGKIRRSIRNEPVPWIATAATVGVFLVLIATRGKKIPVAPQTMVKAAPTKFLTMGLALGVLRVASSLLKPVIIGFVEKKLGGSPSAPKPAKRW